MTTAPDLVRRRFTANAPDRLWVADITGLPTAEGLLHLAAIVDAESQLAVLMLDIDHFKAVNDTYGHLVGDRVLRAVAAACRRVVREGDVLIRYGGEEFLALLPGAGPTVVREVGERIRRAVGETTILEGDQQIAVTVSLGGTIYRDATTESADGLVAAADAALYEAKAAGRDRLILA